MRICEVQGDLGRGLHLHPHGRGKETEGGGSVFGYLPQRKGAYWKSAQGEPRSGELCTPTPRTGSRGLNSPHMRKILWSVLDGRTSRLGGGWKVCEGTWSVAERRKLRCSKSFLKKGREREGPVKRNRKSSQQGGTCLTWEGESEILIDQGVSPLERNTDFRFEMEEPKARMPKRTEVRYF